MSGHDAIPVILLGIVLPGPMLGSAVWAALGEAAPANAASAGRGSLP